MSEFIQKFIKRDGTWVLASSVLTKLMSFATTFLVLKILNEDAFGEVTFAYSYLTFIIPFIGLGAAQAFVRYAPQTSSYLEKKSLLRYTFRNGLVFSILLVFTVFLVGRFLMRGIPSASLYFNILTINLIGFFFLELTKNYARVLRLNRLFAKIDFVYFSLLFLLSVSLSYIVGPLGYAFAIALSPLLTGAFYLGVLWRRTEGLVGGKSPLISRQYWAYGAFAAFGAVSSQLVYNLDVMNIGSMLKDPKLVAVYKIASLLPFSLSFIPLSVINTFFVDIARYSNDKKYLLSESRRYMFVLGLAGLLASLCLFVVSDYVMAFFEFKEYAAVLRVLSFSVIGIFMFRIPFGNVLSAIGKANWNTYLSVFILVLNLILNRFMIEAYGVLGAAISTTIVLWLSGVLSYLAFRFYCRQLD